MKNKHKIVKGTVTIDGQIYKAFEMWSGGNWKVVRGTKHNDHTVIQIQRKEANTATKAIKAWLAILPNG